MPDATLTVAIDARQAEAGATRLERAFAGVRRTVGITGQHVERMISQVSGGRSALDQFAADGQQIESAFERISQKSIEMGQAVTRNSSNVARGAQVIRQAAQAMATEIERIPKPVGAGIFKADYEPSLLSNFSAFAAIAEDIALVRRWLTDLEQPDVRREDMERQLFGVAGSTGTYIYDVTDTFRRLGRVEGFEDIYSQTPQLIETLLSLNRFNGFTGDRLFEGVEDFIETSRRSMPDSALEFEDLIAGVEAHDSDLFRALSDLADGLREGDVELALFAEKLSAASGDIERLVDEELGRPRFLGPSLGNPFARAAGLAVGWPFDQEPPPRPEPLDSSRDHFRRLDAFSPSLAPLDDKMELLGIEISDLGAAIEALSDEEIRVPLNLRTDDIDDFPDMQRFADLTAETLQRRFESYLPELVDQMTGGSHGTTEGDLVRAQRAGEALQHFIDAAPGGLAQQLTPVPSMDGYAPVLADEQQRQEIADAFVADWLRAFLDALAASATSTTTEADKDPPNQKMLRRAINGDQGIDEMITALETVGMVNADGAVSAQANADAMQMLTEAFLAQAETVGEGYTPATKDAAEATMELADAAVGLDAALKAPDPAAMAEDMEELSALGQQVGNSFASAFERAVFSGEELSDVLSALALDLARLVLQQQVLGPLAGGVGGLFDSILGGIGSLFGPSGPVKGGKLLLPKGFHSGGVVSHGAGLGRGISPAMWLGASRYHFGGLAGDEVPAILRRGEEVLTRDDPRHRANGGMAGGGVAIHQTISIDAKAVNENGVDGVAADAVGRQMRAAVRSAVQAEIAQQSRVGGMLNRV